MKYKKYTKSITFFVEPRMYDLLEEVSEGRHSSISNIIRNLVYDHIEAEYGEKYKMKE